MCLRFEKVCGVDEAGRGPLAGPVTASAVILPDNFPILILKDSKQLNSHKRAEVSLVIRRLALDCTVGWSWPEEIDRWNIHRATLLAMKRAIASLRLNPDMVLVDGLFTPTSPYPSRSIVRGDKSIPQIQAASIIAKTTRDMWMKRYASK